IEEEEVLTLCIRAWLIEHTRTISGICSIGHILVYQPNAAWTLCAADGYVFDHTSSNATVLSLNDRCHISCCWMLFVSKRSSSSWIGGLEGRLGSATVVWSRGVGVL